MKKMGQWKENLVTSLEIPRDLAMKETVFTVTGKHQAVVCNYRSVLRYEKEEIILLTFQGKLRIQGKRLKIPMYTPEEMYIEGVITEIILEGSGEIMKKYAGFRNGYVRVRIYGEQTERFLNLCRAREIRISDLRRESELSLTGCLQIRDFFRLAPIHRKTKVKIHILEKHGLPFFFYRSKKRKAFFLGLLLCAGLLLFLSGRLWEIDVEGNVRNSTPEILDFLEQKGIRHGMAKERLSCSEIAAEIRKKYPDITWVSAKLEGTRLLLTVREGIFIQTTEEKDKSACDIMAERDGEIIKMITRSGLPRKKVGDLCKKGEILVSGILELKDDSQEVVKYEAVHADADIYIKRQKAYYHEIPMIYETYEWTGKKKKGIYLKAGRFYLEIADRTKNGWYQIAEEQKMYLTKSFQLPCSIGYITQNQYRKIKKEYTREEVKKLAWHTLQRYEEKLMQKGVQISANNVKIEIDHKTCVSKGFLEIIEKIGEETPVEIPEQPAERTTEDG